MPFKVGIVIFCLDGIANLGGRKSLLVAVIDLGSRQLPIEMEGMDKLLIIGGQLMRRGTLWARHSEGEKVGDGGKLTLFFEC